MKMRLVINKWSNNWTRDATQAVPGFLLDKPLMDWFRDLYLGGKDPSEPSLSPLLSPSFDDLAPALLVTAGFDPLRDEGRNYADKLKAADVPVDYRGEGPMIHGFLQLIGVVREARAAADRACEALRRALK